MVFNLDKNSNQISQIDHVYIKGVPLPKSVFKFSTGSFRSGRDARKWFKRNFPKENLRVFKEEIL